MTKKVAKVSSVRHVKQKYATDLDLLKKEVVIHTYRASGPGGQHRNVTDSAVRLVHRPSGVVVTATESRSQRRNKEKAFERLIARLMKINRVDRPRIPTQKTQAARDRILEEKERLQQKKRMRKRPDVEDEQA